MRGYTLGSQLLEEKIRVGEIETSYPFEERVQPSSYDVVLSGEGYVVDNDSRGAFRAEPDQKVSEVIESFEGEGIRRIDLSEPYELKRGFTYLLRIDDRISLQENEFLKSSPKSSLGRLFLYTRLLADYNLGFDEVHRGEEKLNLYLYVQPLMFNIVVKEGVSLNQVRIVRGGGSKLSAYETMERHEDQTLFYEETSDGDVPAKMRAGDTVYLHLELEGFGESDIVGYRAKMNPEPIDLRKKNHYDAKQYFEPITSRNGRLKIRPQEFYLFATKEVIAVPSDLGGEIQQHSVVGLNGPLHFAGFVDNGNYLNLVLEVRSDEVGAVQLYDGMPIGKWSFYRCEGVEKLYGEEIGSHYYGKGLRLAKYFKEE